MNLKRLFYILTHWEHWQWHIKYVPLYPVWFWYCLRAGSLWFFTASNPTLTFGGFGGESKREMYDQLPSSCYPKSMPISPSLSFAEVEERFVAHNFDYPFAVKPDIGRMGFLFRKIDNVDAFRDYHKRMPVDYIIQDFVKYPIEVSVFYYRLPNELKGTITGFVRKEPLQVKGDGKTSLEQLIGQHPIAKFRLDELRSKHRRNLHCIIPAGETVYLSWAANLSRGGRLVSLAHEKDEKLLKLFDDLSHYAQHFYYGRYDIKCSSIDELKEGKNFLILEYNGSGAEPHHVYGAGNSLLQAYKILIRHWSVLCKISKYNHEKGVLYWKFWEGLKFLRRANCHFKRLKKLDAETLQGNRL